MEALPGEENTTDISSRGELVTRLKERELWWRGQKSVRPPQSNEERMKVNVTVGVTNGKIRALPRRRDPSLKIRARALNLFVKSEPET